MSSSLPVPHPEWDGLLQKRDALQSQIAGVLADLHALNDSRLVVLGRYAAAFGARLMRLQGFEIQAARLKREIELVQSAINSGKEVHYDRIQATLEAEFAAWEAKLALEAARLSQEAQVLDHLLDPEKTQALRQSFRLLARRLHPDLNPTQSPASAALWHRVTAAYEAQDLDELAAMEIITRDADIVPLPDSMESLRLLLVKLRAQLDRLLLKFSDLHKRWPFDQLPVLDDPAALEASQTTLQGRIDAASALCDERKGWLDQLLGN